MKKIIFALFFLVYSAMASAAEMKKIIIHVSGYEDGSSNTIFNFYYALCDQTNCSNEKLSVPSQKNQQYTPYILDIPSDKSIIMTSVIIDYKGPTQAFGPYPGSFEQNSCNTLHGDSLTFNVTSIDQSNPPYPRKFKMTCYSGMGF